MRRNNAASIYLSKPRRSPRSKRLRPSKDSTIRTRRAEFLAFTRKAVSLGLPVAQFTSLGALLGPQIVKAVVDAHWMDNGEKPATCTIDMTWELPAVACDSGCLDQAALEELDDLQAELGIYHQPGLKDKNRAVIRQVLSGTIWEEVVALPDTLLAAARDLQAYAPVKAALKAQLAVAIALWRSRPCAWAISCALIWTPT